MKLIWEKGRITKPGWYWIRNVKDENSIVRIEKTFNRERLLFCDGRLPRDVDLWMDFINSWAGPIPEPKSLKEENHGKRMD